MRALREFTHPNQDYPYYVHIEDGFWITETGAERLHTAPYKLVK